MARNGKIDGWWIKRVAEVMGLLEQEGDITAEQRRQAEPYQPLFRPALERMAAACAADDQKAAGAAPEETVGGPPSGATEADAPPSTPTASERPPRSRSQLP